MRNIIGACLMRLATRFVTQDYEGWKTLYDVNTVWIDGVNANNAAWYKGKK